MTLTSLPTLAVLPQEAQTKLLSIQQELDEQLGYAKNLILERGRLLSDARDVFDQLDKPYQYTWNDFCEDNDCTKQRAHEAIAVWEVFGDDPEDAEYFHVSSLIAMSSKSFPQQLRVSLIREAKEDGTNFRVRDIQEALAAWQAEHRVERPAIGTNHQPPRDDADDADADDFLDEEDEPAAAPATPPASPVKTKREGTIVLGTIREALRDAANSADKLREMLGGSGWHEKVMYGINLSLQGCEDLEHDTQLQ